MANEYLKRTPTGTGNRSVYTWAGWVKINEINLDKYLFSSGDDTSNIFYIQLRRDANNNNINLVFRDGDTTSHSLTFDDNSHRDSSSWMHLVVAVDTTITTPTQDRVKVYINGKRLINPTTDQLGNLDANSRTATNALELHTIGDYSVSSGTYAKTQIFDYYLVDGQALTPDVFGFYKDGDGYISAGSVQATDFRPGQWVPKKPSVIKNFINNSGGFGVNGFYLPMNDSSNFGADFHCDPNSIITLKGEDLPQPRNGAPTTTDAYVSQLRTDPYAANLVLAVPGISTATGSNLVTNGTFDSDVSGWGVSGGTFTWNNGRAQHVTTGSNYSVYQQITGLTIGQRYTFQYTHHSGYSAAYISTNTVSSGNILALGDASASSAITKRGSFTATATSHYVVIYGIGSNTTIWDDVIVKQEDAPKDYSADIKGSGSNKTLTPNGAAGVGYELGGYYGSAMNFDGSGDYIEVGSAGESDFNFGSGDFTIEAWINSRDFTGNPGFGIWDNSSSEANWLIYFNSVGRPRFYISTDGSATISIQYNVNQALNEWMHLAMVRNGPNLVAYLNGVSVGITTTLGTSSLFTTTNDYLQLGRWGTTSTNDGDYLLQDLRIYKGVAKYTGGFDVPKPYTPVNFESDSWRAVADCTANNFATLNPLDNTTSGGTLSNGNLTYVGGAGNHGTSGSIPFKTGKWYCELSVDDAPGSSSYFGIIDSRGSGASFTFKNFYSYQYNSGKKYGGENGSYSAVTYGSAASAGDIIGMAVDMDNKKLFFSLNGTWQNSSDPVAGTNQAYTIVTTQEEQYLVWHNTNTAHTRSFNFGQNPTFSGTKTAGTYADGNGKGLFKYEPPTGFLALCEDNLPTPAIADPGEHFKAVLWTGDGNSSRSITGVGFQPDFVWYKWRSSADSHGLFDSVRGPTNRLRSNSTDAEGTTTGLISFDSDGFSLGSDSSGNSSGGTYVAWCWKAGAGTTSTNTDGTIDSVVSVNQDAGFSIATWTGNGQNTQTIGHGLGKTPDFYIWKSRDNTRNWHCAHKGLTAYNYTLYLDTTGAEVNNDKIYQAPDSTLIYPQNSNTIIGNGEDYVGYFWTEIEGFSKFGSYTGNGSTDGPFVYCGFKPAFVMIKAADDLSPNQAYASWGIKDSSRHPYNIPDALTLWANAAYTEDKRGNGDADTYDENFDFLSNGFKMSSSSSYEVETNGSGIKYIFAAFAESPFKTANAK